MKRRRLWLPVGVTLLGLGLLLFVGRAPAAGTMAAAEVADDVWVYLPLIRAASPPPPEPDATAIITAPLAYFYEIRSSGTLTEALTMANGVTLQTEMPAAHNAESFIMQPREPSGFTQRLLLVFDVPDALDSGRVLTAQLQIDSATFLVAPADTAAVPLLVSPAHTAYPASAGEAFTAGRPAHEHAWQFPVSPSGYLLCTHSRFPVEIPPAEVFHPTSWGLGQVAALFLRSGLEVQPPSRWAGHVYNHNLSWSSGACTPAHPLHLILTVAQEATP